jgi:hypothetical protein
VRSPVILLLLLLSVPAAFASPGEAEPLTNEDVVRMVLAGVPEGRIVERIRDSHAAFDVEPDMLAELRRAGVPDGVIAAMVEKGRSSTSPHDLAAPLPSPSPGWIEMAFDIDPRMDAASNSVVVPEQVQVLEEGGEKRMVPVALAFVLLCTVPTHAPDHWADRTRVEASFGRHREVFFSEATTPVEGESPYVFLDHPASWRAEAAPGIHSGAVGVAVKPGDQGKYLAMFTIGYEDLEVEAGKVTRMILEVRSPGSKRRSRRGFMGKAPREGNPLRDSLTLGDPRLRPTLRILGIEAPAEPEGGDQTGSLED